MNALIEIFVFAITQIVAVISKKINCKCEQFNCVCDIINISNKRSQNEALNNSGRLGYIKEPLIKFIEYDDIVIDLLHLFLRITDQLYKRLFEKIIRFDKNIGSDITLRPNLKLFWDFLEKKMQDN